MVSQNNKYRVSASMCIRTQVPSVGSDELIAVIEKILDSLIEIESIGCVLDCRLTCLY